MYETFRGKVFECLGYHRHRGVILKAYEVLKYGCGGGGVDSTNTIKHLKLGRAKGLNVYFITCPSNGLGHTEYVLIYNHTNGRLFEMGGARGYVYGKGNREQYIGAEHKTIGRGKGYTIA